jgi:hypothetical protein
MKHMKASRTQNCRARTAALVEPDSETQRRGENTTRTRRRGRGTAKAKTQHPTERGEHGSNAVPVDRAGQGGLLQGVGGVCSLSGYTVVASSELLPSI